MALVRVRNSETGEILDVGAEWAAAEAAFEEVDPATPLGLPSGQSAPAPAAPPADGEEPRRRSSF